MPDERRGLDDVEMVLVRRGGEPVLDDERAGASHRLAVFGQGLREGGGMVVLDDVGHLLW
jgi:hypothetical protein